jgi:DNA-binding NarL/FixJ family response regulator
LNQTETKHIRVLLVDDHDIIRQGLKRVLRLDDQIEVVGEAANGAEAIAQTTALMPEVILMDLKMPVMDGITAAREIKKKFPQIYIIILTIAEEYLEEAIEAGVSGFLLKDCDSSTISKAIRQLREGANPISLALNKKLVTSYLNLQKKDPLFSLTERQQQILELICEGVDSPSLCKRLSISLSTQKRELKNIYSVLDVNCRAQAIAVATKMGLIRYHSN